MKRTDQERLNRELRRQEKHARNHSKRANAAGDVKSYAQELFGLLQYDSDCIFNSREDDDLLELMMEMKEDLEETKWELVIKKAVRMTKVKQKDMAMTELKAALEL